MKIIPFDALTADDKLWYAYFRLMDAIQHEVDPGEPPLPYDKRKLIDISFGSNPFRRMYRFIAFPEAGSATASGYVSAATDSANSPAYEGSKHIANLRLYVEKSSRGKGLGALLLRRVSEELAAKEPAVTEFLTPVVLAPGRRFLDRLGGTLSIETAENRLALKDVDWDMVNSWVDQGVCRNKSSRLFTVAEIPLEDIEDYSVVYTETMNQQPVGDISIDMKITPEQIRFCEQKNLESGSEQTTIFSKEKDGKISGLTEIVYVKEAGHKVHQLLTGVRTQYRGRGLGKLLKGRMLLHIKEEYPGVKYITTGNADSNAPMLAINQKLGFKKHLPVKVYKLKLPLKLPDTPLAV